MELVTSIMLAVGFQDLNDGTIALSLQKKKSFFFSVKTGKIGLSNGEAVRIITYSLIRPSILSFNA